MRNLLALLGAGVVTFVVVGWFLGWYQVKATPGKDGQTQVHINLNGEKIKKDIDKGKTKLLGLIELSRQEPAGQTVIPAAEFSPVPELPPMPPLRVPPTLPPLPGGNEPGPAIDRPPGDGVLLHEGDGGAWVYRPR